eukprot:CAMPEP_0198305602 /NCGR_PEP_ID=MMETSP1449-20131203/57990_1 /TAXON_ID=420275 /ORGANISM="Attheya septentrionalis, Strain CCMP2084" /LENGTH=363 /DNA_ID=CAMNT_0044008137 /DNA_START=78 /DNA_END=1166 /DNA_ORIENTATION=+
MSNEESSPLFLASDFCRPRRRRRPRPPDDNRHTNNDHHVVVPVSVSILNQSLCPVAVQENAVKENCDQREEDEFVTIYSSSVSLFRTLQLWDTSVCFLVGTPSRKMCTMAVLLRYDPRGTNGEDALYEDIDRPTIYVPPNVAASVGLHSFASQHETYHAYLTATPPATTTNNIQPLVAYKASVRPIGIPPTDYLPPLSKAHRIRMENMHSNHTKNETSADQNKDDAAIRCYFSKIGDSNNQTIPQQRRLLTVGSLFGVVVSDHDNPEHMRFYRVEQLSFHTKKHETDASSNQLLPHGWVSPNETEVTLLPSSPQVSTTTTTCPRLPNVSMAYSFYKSIGTTATTTTTGVDIMQTTPVVPLASR